MSSVPTLLHRAREGDAQAFSEVVVALYEELRAVARSQRRKLRASETINTTAVVHEAYARLDRGGEPPAFNDRGHFFRVAASAMRGVIVDYARRQTRQKRGGAERPVSLETLGPLASEDLDLDTVLSLDAVLGDLAALDEETARIVELRYFGGLTIPETAEALALSTATVTRRWTFARGWLHRALSDEASGDTNSGS